LCVHQPVECALQDISGGVLVDHRLAAGAACIRLDESALNCRGRQPLVPKRDRKFREPREITGKGAGRLHARTFGPVHVDRQSEHETDDVPLAGEGQEPLGVGIEASAKDGRDRSGEPAIRVAHGDADGLGSKVEAHERTARRQMRGARLE
jgi:hypothetical protein